MNPSAKAQEQRQQEVVHLKEENERLMARVQLLEQAGGPVEDLTLQVNKQLESVPESKAIEGMVVFFSNTLRAYVCSIECCHTVFLRLYS